MAGNFTSLVHLDAETNRWVASLQGEARSFDANTKTDAIGMVLDTLDAEESDGYTLKIEVQRTE